MEIALLAIIRSAYLALVKSVFNALWDFTPMGLHVWPALVTAYFATPSDASLVEADSLRVEIHVSQLLLPRLYTLFPEQVM